jgi:hypothetical protein
MKGQIMVTRAEFFSAAGELVDHTIEGERPPVVRFHYENGQATFDGREWGFTIITDEEHEAFMQMLHDA